MKTLWMAGLALAASGIAQAQFGDPLNFEIPFAFHVGDRELPAGNYLVEWKAASNTVHVTSDGQNNGGAIVFVANSGKAGMPRGRAALVFTKYDNGRHYLAKAMGELETAETIKTRSERELVRSTLKAQATPQSILLVAKFRQPAR